jgi:hypothetical protein
MAFGQDLERILIREIRVIRVIREISVILGFLNRGRLHPGPRDRTFAVLSVVLSEWVCCPLGC